MENEELRVKKGGGWRPAVGAKHSFSLSLNLNLPLRLGLGFRAVQDRYRMKSSTGGSSERIGGRTEKEGDPG